MIPKLNAVPRKYWIYVIEQVQGKAFISFCSFLKGFLSIGALFAISDTLLPEGKAPTI